MQTPSEKYHSNQPYSSHLPTALMHISAANEISDLEQFN